MYNSLLFYNLYFYSVSLKITTLYSLKIQFFPIIDPSVIIHKNLKNSTLYN